MIPPDAGFSALWQLPPRQKEGDCVCDRGAMEAPAPADRVGADTSHEDSQSKSDGLTAAHEGEGEVAQLSGREILGDDAHRGWETHGGCQAGNDAEYDQLGATRSEATCHAEDTLEETAQQEDEPTTHCIGDGAKDEERAAGSQCIHRYGPGLLASPSTGG